MSQSHLNSWIFCLSLLVIASSLTLTTGKKSHPKQKTDDVPLASASALTTKARHDCDLESEHLTDADLDFIARYKNHTVLLRQVNKILKTWMKEADSSSHEFGYGLSPQKKMGVLNLGRKAQDSLYRISNRCLSLKSEPLPNQKSLASFPTVNPTDVSVSNNQMKIGNRLRNMDKLQRQVELQRQAGLSRQLGLRTQEGRRVLLPGFFSNGMTKGLQGNYGEYVSV